MTEELPPIRCLSCGKVLAHRWNKYKSFLAEGYSQEEALNKVDLKNICCRIRMRNPGVVIDSTLALQPNSQELEKSFTRATSQADIQELEKNLGKLSVSDGNKAPTQGALSSMTKVHGFQANKEYEGQNVLIESEEIQLPALPAIPELKKVGEKKMVRTYQAW